MTAQNYAPDEYLMDPNSGTIIQRADDHDDESVSYGVITAMARATDRPVENVAPLSETLDTDALESLFDGGGAEDDRGLFTLQFVHDGCQVLITKNKRISVQPLD